ncbi:Protoheme IX farnesyltransferase 1 [bacterium HR15]|nr:Protoheme IX farnesyltransferase 1 [bacterium HR15]
MRTALKTVALPNLWVPAMEKIYAYWLLSKPRVTLLVWLSTAAGLMLGATGRSLEAGLMIATLLGSWLVVASANAFNQVIEWRSDAQMERTASRPIPSGKVLVWEGWLVAILWGIAGIFTLALFVKGLVAWLGALSIGLYAFVYTPLKRHTSLCTLVGAIPGAIPPMAGWVAATGHVAPPALLLFALQFVWQFPHLWAIAWFNREDYGTVGIRLLPSQKPKRVAQLILIATFALIGVSLLMLPFVSAPLPYLLGALLLGAGHWQLSSRFYRKPDRQGARGVLLASVIYLPLLLLLLLLTH